MTEGNGRRGPDVTANLLNIFVYLGPCAVIGVAVVFAVVRGLEGETPPGASTHAMSLALVASVVYLAFMGGAQWGVATCRKVGPNLVHSLAGIASWAAAGAAVFFGGADELVSSQLPWPLIIVTGAFLPLLVLDGLIVFRQNGQKHEHPELRFLGSLLTVIALVVALITFWWPR